MTQTFHDFLEARLSPASVHAAEGCVKFLLSKTPTAAKGHSRIESLRWASNLYYEYSGVRLPVPAPKTKTGRLKEAHSITDAAWAELYACLECDPSPAAAVVRVIASTGLRVGDVLRLPPRAIYDALVREDGLLSAVVKGGKVVNSSVAGASREDWERLYDLIRTSPNIPLAVAPAGDGSPDAGHAAYMATARALRACGKGFHLHRLRRTVAVQLDREGIDIHKIAKQLGHKSIATTAGYTDEASVEVSTRGQNTIAKYRRPK